MKEQTKQLLETISCDLEDTSSNLSTVKVLSRLDKTEQEKVLCICEGMMLMKNIMQQDGGTEKKTA